MCRGERCPPPLVGGGVSEADGGGVLLRRPRDTTFRSELGLLRDPTSDLLRRPPPPTRGGGRYFLRGAGFLAAGAFFAGAVFAAGAEPVLQVAAWIWAVRSLLTLIRRWTSSWILSSASASL